MRSGEVLRGRVLLAAVIIGLTLYRALVIELGELPLFYDQAYYYYWSLNPDWGYFSKPPMIAWMIASSTAIWGDSELAINAGSLIAHGLTAVVVYLLGRTLYGERAGVWSGIAFMCLPIVGFNSLMISTDAPLLLFWALTVLLFVRATDTGHVGWWLATGVAAGLGLLSKYTMGVLAPGLLLYLLVDRERRRWLGDWRLWLGIAVALVILAPNIAWNAQHEFISFRHTAEISQLDRELFHPDRLVEFLLAQFGVFGPVFMGLFVRDALRRSTYRSDAGRLLLFTALAILVVIGIQAALTRAQANWAAPAFVTATVWIAARLAQQQRARLFGIAMAINLLLLSVLYHYHAIADVLGVELRRGATPYSRILGWRELGAAVSEVAREHPDAILLSDSRKHLAYLSYYTEPKRMQVAWWAPQGGLAQNHYQLVADISRSSADEFLFVGEHQLDAAALRAFRSAHYLGQREVRVLPDLSLTVQLYHLRGFLGYGRE